MLVVCRNNEPNGGKVLEIGKTYFVERVECVHNQIYYKLSGFDNTLFCYWNFNIVSQLRQDKLNELGI